ncbi:MAG: hypothetical protein GY909_16315 [Oligoflexia bacterium]|nr:hypothetical protein [Oligoflexia bacterium]
MKTFNFIFILLFFVGCSTGTYDSSKDIASSALSRSISSDQIDEMSALGRLLTIEKHISATFDSLPQKGNPRFYIFENFKEQIHGIIEDLKDNYPSQMEEQVFIPKDRVIAKKFVQIVSAHKVMSQAGIFVNFNQFIPKDSEVVTKNLMNLDRSMNHYYKALKSYEAGGVVVKAEDFEKAEKSQNVNLLKYLARRVENSYEFFSPKSSHKRNIQRFVKQIRRLSVKKRSSINSQVKRFRGYKTYSRVMNYANSVELPESHTIDGYEDSFEKVESFQFGIELIDFIATNKF